MQRPPSIGPWGSLEGRVALITGGAGAIGRATARRFLGDGASVAIADRSEASLERVARDLRRVSPATG